MPKPNRLYPPCFVYLPVGFDCLGSGQNTTGRLYYLADATPRDRIAAQGFARGIAFSQDIWYNDILFVYRDAGLIPSQWLRVSLSVAKITDVSIDGLQSKLF
jgi:hypothetical protein